MGATHQQPHAGRSMRHHSRGQGPFGRTVCPASVESRPNRKPPSKGVNLSCEGCPPSQIRQRSLESILPSKARNAKRGENNGQPRSWRRHQPRGRRCRGRAARWADRPGRGHGRPERLPVRLRHRRHQRRGGRHPRMVPSRRRPARLLGRERAAGVGRGRLVRRAAGEPVSAHPRDAGCRGAVLHQRHRRGPALGHLVLDLLPAGGRPRRGGGQRHHPGLHRGSLPGVHAGSARLPAADGHRRRHLRPC